MVVECITIKWCKPLSLMDLRQAEGISHDCAGIYLWCWRAEHGAHKAVLYVGETNNFYRRQFEHLASTLGHGGTVCLFDKNEQAPYETLKSDLQPGVAEYKNEPEHILFALGEKSEHFLDIVVKRAKKVSKALQSIDVLFGKLNVPADKRRQIEGGIIDFLVKQHGIGVWPGGSSNDYLIGRRSRCCNAVYDLVHDDDDGGVGAKLARHLLRPNVRMHNDDADPKVTRIGGECDHSRESNIAVTP